MNNVLKLTLDNGINYSIFLPYCNTDYIQKIIYNTGMPYEYDMLLNMLYNFKKFNNPDGLVVDIGMNIGNHSLFFVANKINVVAFEANKKMVDIAKKSIDINNFSNFIKIYNCGISDKHEKAYFESEYHWNYGGMKLTIDNNKDDSIECFPLDSFKFDNKILILKIDIEGMEKKALLGAIDTINHHKPIIYIEGNYIEDFVEIDRILLSLNYIHWDVFGESPTHMYIYDSDIDTKCLLKKNLSKLAKIELYYTVFRQNTYVHNQIHDIITNNILSNSCVVNNKDYRNTLSYKWGNRLINSTKKISNFLKLPIDLYNDYKDFKKMK